METKLSDFHKIKRMRIRQEQNERIISWGSGIWVQYLQLALQRAGQQVMLDGIFGPKTCAAVEK